MTQRLAMISILIPGGLHRAHGAGKFTHWIAHYEFKTQVTEYHIWHANV